MICSTKGFYCEILMNSIKGLIYSGHLNVLKLYEKKVHGNKANVGIKGALHRLELFNGSGVLIFAN